MPREQILGGPDLTGGDGIPAPGSVGGPAAGYPTSNIAPADAPYLLNSIDGRMTAGVVYTGAVKVASVAPDTRYLWLDTSVAPAEGDPYPLKFYDANLAVWVTIDGAVSTGGGGGGGTVTGHWEPLATMGEIVFGPDGDVVMAWVEE